MQLNRKVVAFTIAASVAAAGRVGHAWWVDGSSRVSALALHSNVGVGLAPGRSVTVTVTADGNGSSDASLQNTTLTFLVSTDHLGCTADDFALPDARPIPGVVVRRSSREVVVAVGRLTMLSRQGVDQDSCQGATITVDVIAG